MSIREHMEALLMLLDEEDKPGSRRAIKPREGTVDPQHAAQVRSFMSRWNIHGSLAPEIKNHPMVQSGKPVAPSLIRHWQEKSGPLHDKGRERAKRFHSSASPEARKAAYRHPA